MCETYWSSNLPGHPHFRHMHLASALYMCGVQLGWVAVRHKVRPSWRERGKAAVSAGYCLTYWNTNLPGHTCPACSRSYPAPFLFANMMARGGAEAFLLQASTAIEYHLSCLVESVSKIIFYILEN